MKRRDWKTKKLEKNIFDKKFFRKKNKYRLKNIFFLRKLSLRLNRNLKKKNFVVNFILNKNIKNIFFNKFNNYIKIFLFKSLKNYSEAFPIFFFSKKVFLNYNNFYSILESNNLNYFFIKNYNQQLDQNNLKVVIFNKENPEIKDNLDLPKISDSLFSNKDNLLAVSKNSDNNVCTNKEFYDTFNYYFSYNICLLNSIEIYKIMIILYLNRIFRY